MMANISDDKIIFSSGSICLAADDSCNFNIQKLTFSKGDILTIASVKDNNTCVVTGADGTDGEVPLPCLKIRPAIASYPLLYIHRNMTIEGSEGLLTKEGQFIVIPHDNGGYCVCVRVNQVVKVCIVTMESHCQYTIDGIECFLSLPALIEFYQDVCHASNNNNKLVPLLKEGVPTVDSNDVIMYTDQDNLSKHWCLPIDNIAKAKSIGNGEFGEVFAGTYCSNYQVAIKTLSNSDNSQSLLKEAAIMTHFRHKNLVQLIGVVFDGPSLQMIVMELMSRGSLGKYLVTRGRLVVSQKEQIRYARDVCEGMVYLSSQGYIHRDLAVRNVLLNVNNVAKISDFGLSVNANFHVPNEVGKFPVKWTAPEALKERTFSEKSDVWSFGILLWEIFSFGRTPYPSIYADEVLDNIEDGYLMDPPEGCPDGIYDIMTACWAYQPNERPPFDIIKIMLSRSFGESRTPCSSPLPVRTAFARTKSNAEKLLTKPIASDIYASSSQKSLSELIIANIIVIGSSGAGKTSLIRKIQGDPFRQSEPVTTSILFSERLCEATNNLPWKESNNGLNYNNELSRCIAGRLLEHIKNSSPVSPSLPPLTTTPSSLAQTPSSLFPPQVPPVNRRRSASFTYHGHNMLPPRSAHMSMVIEDMSLQSPPALSFSESQPDGLNRTPPPSPSRKKSLLKRKISFNVFRRTKNDKSSVKLKQAASTSLLIPSGATVPQRQSPLLSSRLIHSPPPSDMIPSSPPTTPLFVSTIPNAIERLIKDKLNDCVTEELPFEVFVRFIDTPGHQHVNTFVISSLLTPSSIVMAVLDSSRNVDQSIDDLVARVNGVFYRKVNDSYKGQPIVILVGTHVDNTTFDDANKYLFKAHKALKSSGCGQFVSPSYFLVSNSSNIDQSPIDTLKSFIISHVTASYSLKIPLKWLKAIDKLKSLSSNGDFIISFNHLEAILKELCNSDKNNDVDVTSFVEFLKRNHLLLNYKEVSTIKDIVFTNVSWFVNYMSALYSLTQPLDPAHPSSHDHSLLLSSGVLSQSLVDMIWPFSKTLQQKLFFFLHQLELVNLKSANNTITLSESQQSLLSLSSKQQVAMVTPPISIVIVPSLVQETVPVQTISSFRLEALYVRVSLTYLPFDLLTRLYVRCLRSYNGGNCVVYSNGGCFTVNEFTTLVVLHSDDNIIQFMLRPSSQDCGYPLQDRILPTADVATTTLTFLQASISDIITTWLDDSVKYELCMRCYHDDTMHYVTLDNTKELLANNKSLKCDQGHTISSLPDTIRPWFGEDVIIPEIQPDDDHLINRRDILLLEAEGIKIGCDGDIAVTVTMSFLDLVSSLENIGLHHLADQLIESRMKTSGIAL